MVHSLYKKYSISQGSYKKTVMLTAIRMNNDINGNPRYKAQVWSCFGGNIWSPKVKGFRRSKDDTYILKSVYNLEESMDAFIKVFEESINE